MKIIKSFLVIIFFLIIIFSASYGSAPKYTEEARELGLAIPYPG